MERLTAPRLKPADTMAQVLVVMCRHVKKKAWTFIEFLKLEELIFLPIMLFTRSMKLASRVKLTFGDEPANGPSVSILSCPLKLELAGLRREFSSWEDRLVSPLLV